MTENHRRSGTAQRAGRSLLSGASIGAFTGQCPIAERGRNATFLLEAAPERPREADLRPRRAERHRCGRGVEGDLRTPGAGA
jgi:hypothetical protein